MEASEPLAMELKQANGHAATLAVGLRKANETLHDMACRDSLTGFVVREDHSSNKQVLIKAADRALYVSKYKGAEIRPMLFCSGKKFMIQLRLSG